MKHKKGFAAVLLTLIISALLSVSAFAASDGWAGHYLRYGKRPVCTGHTYYGAPMGNNDLPGL